MLNTILQQAGATYPRRDAIDARVVAEVKKDSEDISIPNMKLADTSRTLVSLKNSMPQILIRITTVLPTNGKRKKGSGAPRVHIKPLQTAAIPGLSFISTVL